MQGKLLGFSLLLFSSSAIMAMESGSSLEGFASCIEFCDLIVAATNATKISYHGQNQEKQINAFDTLFLVRGKYPSGKRLSDDFDYEQTDNSDEESDYSDSSDNNTNISPRKKQLLKKKIKLPKANSAASKIFAEYKKHPKKRNCSPRPLSAPTGPKVKEAIKNLYTQKSEKDFHEVCTDIFTFGRDYRIMLLAQLLGKSKSSKEAFISDVNSVSFYRDEIQKVYLKSRTVQAPPLPDGSKLLHLLVHQGLLNSFKEFAGVKGVDNSVTNGAGKTVKKYSKRIGCNRYANFLDQLKQ